MSKFTQIEVIKWETEEVEQWAIRYGFHEQEVINNIRSYHIGGAQLLSGSVTAEFIGITIPLKIRMFGARIDELIDRDLAEKAHASAVIHLHKKARLDNKEGIVTINEGEKICEQVTEEEEKVEGGEADGKVADKEEDDKELSKGEERQEGENQEDQNDIVQGLENEAAGMMQHQYKGLSPYIFQGERPLAFKEGGVV
jgi:hypothetical protein